MFAMRPDAPNIASLKSSAEVWGEVELRGLVLVAVSGRFVVGAVDAGSRTLIRQGDKQSRYVLYLA